MPAPGALDQAPRFDLAAAAHLAREHYGVDGTAQALPSERDQNFLIEDACGRRLVLKIANAREERSLLEALQSALEHVAHSVAVVPRLLSSVRGERLLSVADERGRAHLLWAVAWLPGTPLAHVRYRSPALLEDLGRGTAALAASLATFDAPAIHRSFYWDLANGRRVVSELRPLLDDDAVAAAVDALIAAFDRDTAPLLSRLPCSAIHGDLNDHNLLVEQGRDDRTGDQRLSGIVDFGDMVHSWTIADLAIATAYALLDERGAASDPLASATAVLRGYTSARSLLVAEVDALWGLAMLRLCTSACIAASQRRQRPDNSYLDISQTAIRFALPRLAAIPFRFARATLRRAAGHEPVGATASVVGFLRAHSSSLAPLLGIDLASEHCLVLDLSVGAPIISGDLRENAEPALSPRVQSAMNAAGVRVAVGRWDEPRLLYQTDAFANDGGEDERRTIHLGLDLFADAGTPVFAPLAGVVHAVADNDAPQDYGRVIILRHETDTGVEFFTLYGHLSRESLSMVKPGRVVKAGDQIGTLGTAAVNGGWTPHLHLQIIVDLLELGVDYPGVGRPADRDVWRHFCPDANLLARVPPDRFPWTPPSRDAALRERRSRIGRNLSVGYSEPVKLARGWMQWLYDDEARRLLDAYNNVPHVGHCHPRVVRAGQQQMAVLNTNTRYLSDLLNEYAARLSATLPAPLRVCYFVNSASEANELALRLARAATRATDTIVLEAAYHGNTTTLVELSPYKHAGPGGSGAPPWVHVAPLPDTFRGIHRGADAGAAYARAVHDIVQRLGRKGTRVAAFLAESCPSVAGQIMLPPAYLADVYRFVRDAGGVCIADEVQTGLGRVGTSFWAFETQQVVPDIVVAGKPLGNGHPIGAVITTPEIAAAFDNGMEYFSTFGGNNVSCAIGLAVLDVLRDEQLQEHAREVGQRLLAGLRSIMGRHELIGDVRGSGLFLGVELVRDRTTLRPAAAEASYVVNRMRQRGILLGTDGPLHNVLKIRPPMPFDDRDADRLVDTMDDVLLELQRRQ